MLERELSAAFSCLYLRGTDAHGDSVVDSTSLTQAKLGHPSLTKFQDLVPLLSKLSTLSCELC